MRRFILEKPSSPLKSAYRHIPTLSYTDHVPPLWKTLTMLSRLPRLGVQQFGGIPPIICQQQRISVTLHLGPVLSALRRALPLRRSSGLPLQHTSAVTSAPPTDGRHSSPPSSSHRSPTGSTRSTRCSHSRAPPHGCDRRPTRVTGSLSKPRRQRQRERSQIKGLMRRTIAVHMRYKSLYILLPSSAKQLEMTKFFVV